MSGKWLRPSWVCVVLTVLWLPSANAAEPRRPLEPLDLSSPRATLNSFLTTGDQLLLYWSGTYWHSPSRLASKHLMTLAAEVESTLDLNAFPPAARFEAGRDGVTYLYEVLSRIELPAEIDIPDATAYASLDDREPQGEPARWTIPNTEITLVRIAEGPRTRQFLFSAATVARAREFFEKTRTLPYRRDVPIKHFAEKRMYLSTGWIVTPSTIEGFPSWLKHTIYDQAVWKWIALILLIAFAVTVVTLTHRLARHKLAGHSPRVQLRRLVTPIALVLATSLVLNIANRQLSLSGWLSERVTLVAATITYIALMWITWTSSVAFAELIIASPKIPDQSLNAHLLRFATRSFAILAIIAITFYTSNQLGAPLYSLVAGIGVGGIAIALAAQGTIENFIGSLNLFADHPVRVGDFCRYGEDASSEWQRIGTVESIGIRSTRIRGVDHTVTTIPNAEFSKMHIVNYTTRNRMLLLGVFGLRYETTDDQLRFVLVALRTMLLAHPRVADSEPTVRFIGFGDFALNVEIRVDLNTSDRDEFRAIREDIYLRVMSVVKDAGTCFAFPSSTVYHTRDRGLDDEKGRDAEAQVRVWRSEQELPFPNFTAEYLTENRNTLDYPPKGSPQHDR